MAGNNLDTYIRIRAGVEGLSDLNNLVHAIEQAGGDVTQLRQAATQLQNTWNTLTTEEQNRQLQELANTANSLARSTNNATQQMERLLGVRSNSTINAEIAQVNTALATLRQRLNSGTISQEEFNRMSQAGQNRLNTLQAELNQTSNSLNRVDDSAKKSSKAMESFGGGFTMLKTAIAGYLGINLVQNLADTADAYTTLAARIKVAVGESGNVKDAMAGVQQVALATNSDLGATAQLFTKINDVGKQMGMTQNDVLALTKTINQAIQLGGGSAQASEAAITQLTQALQSGVLRGDEFNSIMEQAPGISQALASSLGVTTGELRKMAEEGKLSSQTVIKALKDQANEIDNKFGQFPKTISQAMQNIKTQWEIVVGEFNTDSGTSAVVVNALQIIGDNLGVLKNLFNDIGDGISWVSDQFSNIDASTIETVKATLAQAYDTVKDLAKSIGEMGLTAWEAFKSVLDSVSPVFAAFTSGQNSVNGLQVAMNGLRLIMGVMSDGVKIVSIAFTEFVGALQFAAGGISALQAKVLNFLGFDTLAKQAEDASNRLFAAGEKSLKRADQQIMDFKSKTREAWDDMHKTESEKNAESVASNKKALDDKTKAWQDFVLSEKNWAKERVDLESQLQQARKNGDEATTAKLVKNIADIDKAEQDSKNNKQKIEKEKLDAVVAYANASIKANGGVASEQLRAEIATKGYSLAIDQAGKMTVAAMGNAKDSSTNLGLSLQATAMNAAKGLGVDVKQALNQLNPAFERNVESVRQVADGYDSLKKEGQDASNLLYASLNKLLEGAKSQKEIQTVQKMYEEYGKQGKISTDQVTAALDQTHKKTLEIEQSINGVTTAYKTLGIESKSELDKKAAEYKQAYDDIAKDATATNEIKKQAYEKYAEAAIKANNNVADSELKARAFALGYADVVVENGKVVTKTTEDVHQANQKWIESQKSVTKATKDTGDAAKEAAEKGKQAAAEQEKAHSSFLGGLAKMYDNFTGSIAKGLQNVGISGEQSIQLMNNALKGQAYMMNSWTGFFQGFANARERVKASIDAFNEVRNSAIGMTQTLGSATVTTNDLGMAQLVLNRATTSTVDGIVKMDNATLDNLKRQIDSTKQKFDDLSKSAKDTADGLQTQLARLKGDDTTARQLEQTKKLTELQERLNEARKRGNAEEIAQLQRAYDLQKQINDEENRQASVKLQQEQQAKQAQIKKQTQANSSYNQPVQSTSSNTQSVNAKDVANSFADLIEQAKKEGANLLAQQLMDEAKRLAR